MYVEERTYTLQVGKAAEYFKNYAEFGMKVQLKHLPDLVGYYVTEVGELNQVTHLWAYESLDERDRRRAAMQADPEWHAYLAKNRPFMIAQQTRLMKCAPFFVERLKKMLAAVR
ncbi:MAG TPA: NIPSNAP family protein [Burkholderiales bacterium]|nr:NIPSNAP family protein [Burkholderiales bacterium]